MWWSQRSLFLWTALVSHSIHAFSQSGTGAFNLEVILQRHWQLVFSSLQVCSNRRHLMRDQREDTMGSLRLDGRYSNYLTIGHNAFEFLFDFGQFYIGSEEPDF